MKKENSISATIQPLLQAISFAARAHHGQLRKDEKTPYASHAFRVCFILRDVFEVSDPRALAAAVLHDTIEDTTTDFDDLEEEFGAEIARWVAALSKDSRLQYEEREEKYSQTLAKAPWQVQVCKLADIVDNLLDIAYLPPEKRLSSIRKKKRYLDAIHDDLKQEATSAWTITSQLYEELEARYLEK